MWTATISWICPATDTRKCPKQKSRWSELIEGYYNQDRDFALVVSLIDIRHELALDRNMVQFLMDARASLRHRADQADKLSKQQQMKQRAAIKKRSSCRGACPWW